MRCSTLRGTFCSVITLATPRQDWTGSNPSRREGEGCGFTLSRSHSCCAVRLVYIQISPGHIWTTLYIYIYICVCVCVCVCVCSSCLTEDNASIRKTNWWKLYRGTITVYCKTRTLTHKCPVRAEFKSFQY